MQRGRQAATRPRGIIEARARGTTSAVIPACLAFVLMGVVAACGDHRGTDPTVVNPPVAPEPPPAPRNLVGTVRNYDRLGLPGVTVAIVGGQFAGRQTVSDDAGVYRFGGVYGPMTIAASRDGYERYLHQLNLAADSTLDIDLVRAVPADSIQFGGVIETSVPISAPPCDPVKWDAAAPCRRFVFVSPATGTLSIAVTWSAGPELDVTLVTLENAYISTSTDAGPGRVELSGPVMAGKAYEVRVNAYYAGHAFTLRAELR